MGVPASLIRWLKELPGRTSNRFLASDLTWKDAGGVGAGDMLAATYDPTNVASDAFDMDNMAEGTDTKVMTAAERTKLAAIAAGAEVNVNADWNSGAGDSQILNKPALDFQPHTAVLDATDASFTSAKDTKLSGIAAGAEVNVNADWNAGSGDAQIMNKPDLSSLHARSHAMNGVSDHTAGNWKLFYSNGSGQVIELALAASGYLKANGVAAAPTFDTPATNPWTMLVVTGDETVTNSATLADSAYLTFTTQANTNYHIRLRVLMNSGNATADIKYRLTHAGTTTRVRRVRTYCVPAGTSATYPTVAPATAFDAADQTLTATATGDCIVYEDIFLQVGASGGVLKFAFAQNTQTPAASVILYEGSYMEYMTT